MICSQICSFRSSHDLFLAAVIENLGYIGDKSIWKEAETNDFCGIARKQHRNIHKVIRSQVCKRVLTFISKRPVQLTILVYSLMP